MPKPIARVVACAAMTLAAPAASASCGSAFCLVNTNWGAQGVWTEPGWRADVRFEYIDQDQPRAGTHDVAVGAIPRHHDEVRTVNRNVFATLDYGFSPEWGASIVIPWIDRTHDHIHNHRGEQVPESWSFSELGDVRLQGRYQRVLESPSDLVLSYAGVIGGLKLPTGKTDVANANGDIAERTLQPGTGTTDAVLGAYFRQALGQLNASWFTQVVAQLPLDSHDDYKPGRQILLDVGGRWEATDRLGLVLQLNAAWKARDSGAAAEPEDSGSRTVFVSPGLTFAVTPAVNVYAFVQLPVYQHVNGVQLVAKTAYAAGFSAQF